MALLIGLSKSEVLSTLLNPTIVLSIPDTIPVKIGFSLGAFKSRAVTVALLNGLFISDVLSTLDNPTIVLSIPVTVPVKLGSLSEAFKSNFVSTSVFVYR